MLEYKINGMEQRTELVILPEMFSTGFSMNPAQLAEPMDGPTIKWMQGMAAKNNIVLTGSLIVEEEGHYFNRLIWMLPNGQFGFYDKRHLFAFAGEHNHYSAGSKRLIASVKGWKINLQICYDLRFPVWARQAYSAPGIAETNDNRSHEYDLLVYVANWPERRNLAWKTLLVARAIENQCYTIGVNRVGTDGNNIYHSGNSLITDPLGEILYHRSDDEDLFTLTLEKDHLNQVRQKFPFGLDADEFRILN